MPDIITRTLLESKGIPTRDIVAAIWGRKLSGSYEPAELTGTLPLTFRSNGTAILDYRIYGNTLTKKLNLWEWGNTNYRIDLTTPIAANTTLTYAVFKDGIADRAEGIYLYDVNGSRILNAACANSNGSRIYATVTPTRDVHRIELSPMAADDALRMLIEGDTPPDEYISPETTDVQGVGVRTENLFDKDTYLVGGTRNPSLFTNYRHEIRLKPNTTYTMSSNVPHVSGANHLYVYSSFDSDATFYICCAGKPITFTTHDDGILYFEYARRTYYAALLNGTYYVMLVEGSTAPDQYIPYGYKLPMVSRTENLLNQDADGWERHKCIDENGLSITYGFFDASPYIKILPNKVYTLVGPNSGFYAYSAFYDADKKFISSFISHGKPFYAATSPSDAKYIRCSVLALNRYPDAARRAMLIEGSTAPDQYIPYHRTDTPIYISDTQLMQDEYVSYGEQKIYREVGGTLTPTDPPVPLPELPTFSGADTVLDYEETPAPEEMWVKYLGKKGD